MPSETIKTLKFITKENLETFAKNLYIPQANKVCKFSLTPGQNKNINGNTINLLKKSTECENYGASSLFYEISVKTSKNSLILYFDGLDYIYLDCEANKENIIDISETVNQSYSFFLIAEYEEK